MLFQTIIGILSLSQSGLAELGSDAFRIQGEACVFPSCNPIDESLLATAQCLETGDCGSFEYEGNHTTYTIMKDYAPEWSLPPKCTEFDGETDRYCLFTSHTFARNRGITIFTTPQRAREMLKLPAFKDPHAHDGANDVPNPPYEQRQMPGKGMGLIANRTLHRGDHIFSITPVVVIEEDVFSNLGDNERRPFQAEAVEKLPKSARDSFLNLLGHFGGDPYEDKFNTNAFSVEVWPGEDEEHVYNICVPEISRLNHDCRPNAHYYFDPETFTHHVHALRTIMSGEEITISYIDPAQTRDERRSFLKTSWGFECSCSACTQPNQIVKASDGRVNQMIDITSKLADHSSDSDACPAMAETLISLYQQERLDGPIAEAYAYTSFEYNGVGDVWAAQRYARLGIESGILYGGPMSADVEELEDLLEDPRYHWSWKFRER